MPLRKPAWSWLTEFAWAVLLFVLAFACALAWAKSSKSEVGDEGTGLTALQERAGRPPFIFRRLGPEASHLVWRMVPDRIWRMGSEWLHRSGKMSQEVRSDWEWSPDDEPRLLAHLVATSLFFVIFALSMRSLISSLYDTPPWVRLMLPLLLMVLLVGGKGYKTGWHAYPYDISNVAVFWLTVVLLVRGNWLAIPSMVLAAYSKETTLLLVPTAFLVWPSPKAGVRLALAGVLATIYLVVRIYIHRVITPLPFPQYSYVFTNGFDVLFPGNWITVAVVVLFLLLLRDTWEYPTVLRRLAFIPVSLLAVLTVKGWIYEQRAYLEGMPVVVLMLSQTLAMRYGRHAWLRPRDAEDSPRSDALDARSIRELARDLYVDAPPLRQQMAIHRASIAPLPEVLRQVPRGSAVLDVGCGNGLLLATLLRSGAASRGLGVDISGEAVAIAVKARQRLGVSSETLEFQAREPHQPLPNEQFDCVLLVDVLHHVPQPAQTSFLRDVAERVRPGGRLVYKDMCRKPFWRSAMNRLHDLLTERQWVRYYPIDEVERVLSDAGFSCIHRQSIPMLWYGHELRVFVRAPSGDGQNV